MHTLPSMMFYILRKVFIHFLQFEALIINGPYKGMCSTVKPLYSALVSKKRLKMYMFNLRLICHLPIPPSSTILVLIFVPRNLPSYIPVICIHLYCEKKIVDFKTLKIKNGLNSSTRALANVI